MKKQIPISVVGALVVAAVPVVTYHPALRLFFWPMTTGGRRLSVGSGSLLPADDAAAAHCGRARATCYGQNRHRATARCRVGSHCYFNLCAYAHL